MFNHCAPVNIICVVMSCLEMDVGKYHEIAFSMTVQRDFKCQLSRAHYDTLFTERDTVIKACDA